LIKNIIKDNAFLYLLYFHIVRKHRGIKPPWFTNNTDIYFDGYPRTGNTFLSHLLRNVLYNLKSVHHLHCVAAIKIALRKKIPTYILVRNPLDAISSNYLKHFSAKKEIIPQIIDQAVLMGKLEDYISYYSYVLKKINELNVINFETLIANPFEIISIISHHFNEKIDKTDFEYTLIYYYKDEEELKKIPKDYKFKNKDGGKNKGGARDKLGSSLPNDFKDKIKKELSQHLCQQKKSKIALQIYSDILSKSEKPVKSHDSSLITP
jgi:hypothetical protein